MRLIIVRHGETEGNIKRIIQGHMQEPLDEAGIQQAKRVAERLKTEKIDAIYSSDLKRARMTAEEIIKHYPDVPVHFVKELRERDYGTATGKTRDEVRSYRKKQNIKKHEYTPEGAESLLHMKNRLMGFLEETRRKHKDQTVLFVTHGGVKRVMVGTLNGMPLEEAIYT
ncbi:MAG: histidine phosphatase family protein, partial [Candidatus Aenigmarchaeota archaeon]